MKATILNVNNREEFFWLELPLIGKDIILTKLEDHQVASLKGFKLIEGYVQSDEWDYIKGKISFIGQII